MNVRPSQNETTSPRRQISGAIAGAAMASSIGNDGDVSTANSIALYGPVVFNCADNVYGYIAGRPATATATGSRGNGGAPESRQ